MKKSIFLLILIGFNVCSSEYIIEINKANYGNSVLVEDYVAPNVPVSLTCDLPEVLNETQDSCIDPIATVGWIATTLDNCNGMRQTNFDPNVYIARSNNNIYNEYLEIPVGYHWVTKSEYINLFNISQVANKNTEKLYEEQCGLSSYPYINGTIQLGVVFKDNGYIGMHSGYLENSAENDTRFDYRNNFLGYVLYKN